MNEADPITEAADISHLFRPGMPKIKALADELQTAINNYSIWQDRCNIADDARWCFWPGQHDDGRKHQKEGSIEAVFPWENASDTRIRLCEEKVREADLLCDAAFRRGRIQMTGREVTDAAWSQRCSLVLQWLIHTEMRESFSRERKLAVDYRHHYGVSCSLVEWEMGSELVMQDLDLLGLADLFGLSEYLAPLMEAGIGIVEFLAIVEQVGANNQAELDAYNELRNALDLIRNPEREKEFVDTLKAVFPTVKRSLLKRCVEDLRTQGQTRLPVPKITVNRPLRRALLPGRDVFFPVNVRTIQESPWVAVREWLTKSELEAKGQSPDPDMVWSRPFIDKLLKHEGVSSTAELDTRRNKSSRWSKSEDNTFEASYANYDGLYEVFHIYYWANDSYGVRGLYRTIFSPHAIKDDATNRDCYAWHGLLDYAHGRIPVTEHVFFRDNDILLMNGGIPYLLYTYQNEIKDARDGTINASQISILPPVRRNIREMGTPLTLAPGKPLYESLRGTVEFMQPPNSRVDLTQLVERNVRDSANRLLGSVDGTMPPPLIQLHQAGLVSEYLEEEATVLTQIFQLAQQFIDEVTVTRITGRNQHPFRVSREEIRGQFDLAFSFDPIQLDPEGQMKKLDLVIKVIEKLDINNISDRNRLLELALEVIDQNWADQLITDTQQAAMKEISDEQLNLALILSGQEPPMKPQGQNFQLRLQVLSQAMQNPAVVEAIQQDRTGIKGSILENRLKHLQFQVGQQKNAQIGRDGTAPLQPAQ